MAKARIGIFTVAIVLLAAACSAQPPDSCPEHAPVGLDQADEIAADGSLPFRFPLAESSIDQQPGMCYLGVSNQCPPDKLDCYEYPQVLFHAAEDFKRPAATAVYALADGKVRYSGRAGGYGWLILIDHPQANLYSLYGHLSPSRWKLKAGSQVERGELIGYLGDPDENGGSKRDPLRTHLHFGVRAGQVADYPSRGEWRSMGGWIALCPQDVGWLPPSLVITGQEIPPGGFPQPSLPFWTRWGLELWFIAMLTIGGLVFLASSRKGPRFLALLPGSLMVTAWGLLRHRGLLTNGLLLGIAGLFLAVGVYLLLRRD